MSSDLTARLRALEQALSRYDAIRASEAPETIGALLKSADGVIDEARAILREAEGEPGTCACGADKSPEAVCCAQCTTEKKERYAEGTPTPQADTSTSDKVKRLAMLFAQEWLRPDQPEAATEALSRTLTTAMLAFHATARSVETRAAGTPTPQADIESAWKAIERGWDIEPRDYFEREAVKMGFKSPLEMAIHWMWKREPKPKFERAASTPCA